ncbi:hypothetical protein TNCV_202571 [Trichonephila clavipes]|nr:hypothetical protein TNCV_202571 [Trichonephila clavipes]
MFTETEEEMTGCLSIPTKGYWAAGSEDQLKNIRGDRRRQKVYRRTLFRDVLRLLEALGPYSKVQYLPLCRVADHRERVQRSMIQVTEDIVIKVTPNFTEAV